MAETTLQQSAFTEARLRQFWIKAKGWIAVAVIAIALAQAVFPIIWLGLPSDGNAERKGSPGGVLAQMRTTYELGESDLGDVDRFDQRQASSQGQ